MARVEAFCGYPRGRRVSGPAAVLVLYGREEHSWSKTADQRSSELVVLDGVWWMADLAVTVTSSRRAVRWICLFNVWEKDD